MTRYRRYVITDAALLAWAVVLIATGSPAWFAVVSLLLMYANGYLTGRASKR